MLGEHLSHRGIERADARVAARLGDDAGAIALTTSAKESGYEGFASMRKDSDLKDLVGSPQFDALFS